MAIVISLTMAIVISHVKMRHVTNTKVMSLHTT